jgi:hypothetical protein
VCSLPAFRSGLTCWRRGRTIRRSLRLTRKTTSFSGRRRLRLRLGGAGQGGGAPWHRPGQRGPTARPSPAPTRQYPEVPPACWTAGSWPSRRSRLPRNTQHDVLLCGRDADRARAARRLEHLSVRRYRRGRGRRRSRFSATEGTWKFLEGSGKWKGITGGGSAHIRNRGPPGDRPVRSRRVVRRGGFEPPTPCLKVGRRGNLRTPHPT